MLLADERMQQIESLGEQLTKFKDKYVLEQERHLRYADESKKFELEVTKSKKNNKELQGKIDQLKEANEELQAKCEVLDEEYKKLKQIQENEAFMA